MEISGGALELRGQQIYGHNFYFFQENNIIAAFP